MGDRVMRKVSLRENGYNAPAIENMYPLSDDNMLKRKNRIRKSLDNTIPVLVTILPRKNKDNISVERKTLGITIE